ncbi:unnamed protein product [Ambrosiozyma monospora]|uniref:Unnamed protein product n=1 Tax=Ambrosiozyma monospora TaxID=43982 RepID=A0A9W6T4H9_AMBMO|nr:unnamed protein product [Ambrosiozyma monospora]
MSRINQVTVNVFQADLSTLLHLGVETPKSYWDAVKTPQGDLWKKSMAAEIKTHQRYHSSDRFRYQTLQIDARITAFGTSS